MKTEHIHYNKYLFSFIEYVFKLLGFRTTYLKNKESTLQTIKIELIGNL